MKIAELTIGQMAQITLVVKSAIARETKAKKPYLQLDLYDGVDIISGNYWDWTSGILPDVNAILDVTAQVTEWQGAKQLNVKSLRNNTDKVLADFAPVSTASISDTYKDAYALACTINNAFLRDVTLTALDKYRSEWLTVPGAVSVHHAYVGGTLIHSYSVARIAAAIAENIPDANRDLCIAGGLLHDIGKLHTYALNGVNINMTDEGMLYEHLVIGTEMVTKLAEQFTDHGELALLRHIILSHHGVLEYGSPVFPQCIEAHIVNRADSIDAATEQIRAAARKVPAGAMWTDRLYTLNNRAHMTPAYVGSILTERETV